MPSPLASQVSDFLEPLIVLPNSDAVFYSVERAKQSISFNNDNNNKFQSMLFSKAFPSFEATNFSRMATDFLGYSPHPLVVNNKWSEEYPIYEKHFMQPMASEEAGCLSLDVAIGGSYQEQEQGFLSSKHLELRGDTESKLGNHATVASNISTSDKLPFKVGRISAEERKEKIRRGRFAKSEDFENVPRSSIDNNDDEVVLKDKESCDSSDNLVHVMGVKSFKYNFTLHSWI